MERAVVAHDATVAAYAYCARVWLKQGYCLQPEAKQLLLCCIVTPCRERLTVRLP